jgi:hypothetical protein
MQGICLLLAASGYLPHALSFGVVAVSLGSLIWSFGRDILWLRRTSHVQDGEVEEMLEMAVEAQRVAS